MVEKNLELFLEGPKTAARKTGPGDEKRLYDIAILGAGPAGLCAGVYSARKKLSCLMVSQDIGGQLGWTSEIENYIGFQYIQGKELIAKFREQVEQYPLDLEIGAPAISVREVGGRFLIGTADGKVFQARAVIVATGKRSRMLNVPGEKELRGKGVTYCATCDAPLFAGKPVAVIGGGNSALTAVSDLLKYASKIYIINILPALQADEVLVEHSRQSGIVEELLGYRVLEIKGKETVTGIAVKPTGEGKTRELAVEGVMIEIGLVPNSEPVLGFLDLNPAGEIIVDCACQTGRAGVFAAGDVTIVPEKQIVVAAGEGAKAALAAYKYLLNNKLI